MSFVVYKSSAGSGKTFTLVKEYLCLILPEPSKFRHILAITFTNKAANEMKERVLKNLQELSVSAENRDPRVTADLMPLIVSETGLSETEIMMKAKESLKLIMHNYSDFAIGTIDSFSHRIIRTFAHDFGLPVSFSIELDSDELINTAVNLLLDRVGDDRELTALLVKFIGSRMDEERSSDIESILNDFARVLLNESGMTHLAKLKSLTLTDFNRIADFIFSRIRSFESGIQSIAQEAVNLIRQNDIPLTSFYQGDKGIGGYFRKLAHGQTDKLKSDSYAVKTIAEGKWTSGNATGSDVEKILGLRDELTALFQRIIEEREKYYADYLFFKVLGKTIYPLAVLHEIEKTLDEFKKQNDMVHISEFNRRIASVILNEPVPFLYERLGERFNHLLIDEFQDTSKLQWSNLLPLIDNSLASGYFNLVVGDGKQAIYRWRNGDVEQFTELPAIPGSENNSILRERENMLKRNYTPSILRKNFRSSEVIVGFNSRFFTYLSEQYPDELGKVYDAPEQEVSEGKSGGYVQVEFISKKDDTVSYRDRTLDKISEKITELMNEGFRMQDIAILCRKKRDGNDIARFLTGTGVRVVSSEALLLAASPEVNFITGMMRLLYKPRDLLIAAQLISYLVLNGRIREKSLHTILSDIDREKPSESFFGLLKVFDAGISALQLKEMPVYELAEELVRRFFNDRFADPYLLFFLEKVFAWTGKNSSGLGDFLEWWDSRKDELSVIIPEGLDAIRIMTIHKAKGLEFPAVIIPFAHDKKDLTGNWLWVDTGNDLVPGLNSAMLKAEKGIRETRFSEYYEEESRKSTIDLVNVLYVAMTRAEKRLFIMTQPAPESGSDTRSVPVFLAGFLKHTGDWDDERTIFEFGSRDKYLPKGEILHEKPVTVSEFISGNWQKMLHVRPRSPKVWDLDDPKQKNRWGNLVHLALSGIRYAGDTERVLDELFSTGMADEADREKLTRTIRSVVDGPETARFFREEPMVRNEAEILLPDGNIIRPDRVIFDDNKLILIDFKTGRPHDSHRRQIIGYGCVLKEMGYKEIRQFLLYVTPEIKLVEVNDG